VFTPLLFREQVAVIGNPLRERLRGAAKNLLNVVRHQRRSVDGGR
jgi:hypothetical protein